MLLFNKKFTFYFFVDYRCFFFVLYLNCSRNDISISIELYILHRLKKWGMDSYLYAPKDDYKHRAYWRDLYTVEEAEHLTGLITAAREYGITFYYALSPGLDITYSSSKEVTALKRKLEQVSQFGCTAFALLFDDIEPEMSEADKEVFQSFAQAQVYIQYPYSLIASLMLVN